MSRDVTAGRLVAFLDSVKDHGADPRWHRFVFPLIYNNSISRRVLISRRCADFTKVSSDFYPDLECHYSHVIDEWHDVGTRATKKGRATVKIRQSRRK